jgi:hypothetical protein
MRLRRSNSRPLSFYAAAQRPRATGLGEGSEREVPASNGHSLVCPIADNHGSIFDSPVSPRSC